MEPKKQNFIKRFFAFMWRHKWWSTIICLILIGIILWIYFATRTAKKDYITIDISRGDLTQTVTASGEIQPVNTINVGSQVSGTIENIFVDYNSVVKKGDVLLTIEPSVLQSTVDESKAY